MLRVKKDNFDFQNSFSFFGCKMCRCGGLLLFSQSVVSDSATPWIEGVYSERRNGQMQRHEIKVKTEMNNLLTEFNFQWFFSKKCTKPQSHKQKWALVWKPCLAADLFLYNRQMLGPCVHRWWNILKLGPSWTSLVGIKALSFQLKFSNSFPDRLPQFRCATRHWFCLEFRKLLPCHEATVPSLPLTCVSYADNSG